MRSIKPTAFLVFWFGAFLVFFVFHAAQVHAEDCVLQPDLDALSSLQETASPNDQAALVRELNLRKSILTKTLMCATSEADDLKTQLSKVQLPSGAGLEGTRDRLLGQFDEVLQYYDLQKTRVNDLGVRGSKDFARNLSDWRATVYAPIVGNAANFRIWLKNQILIQTADHRLALVSKTIESLKLTDNKEIEASLNDAEQKLDASKTANKALGEIYEAQRPEDSRIADLTKNSLESLADIYQDFFDVSDAVNKLLPH